MDLGLRGARVWVTGASGGIGGAVAEHFLAEGARVLLGVGAQAERVAPLAARAGDRARVARADVRDPEALRAAARAGLAAWGGLDVCVPAAGIWPPQGLPLHRQPRGRIEEVIRVNLLGVLYTVRAFLEVLAETAPPPEGTAIVLVGSTAGRFGEEGHAPYAAAKAGLRGLLLSLKNELVRLDPKGRVNLVEPGWTETPMTAGSLTGEGLARITATMALRRPAAPEDVARAVLFLASPRAARHVTGEVLAVAGGMEGRLLWPPPG